MSVAKAELSESVAASPRAPPEAAPPVAASTPDERLPSGEGRAGLEERVFSMVYRQMHALCGRWRPDFDDLVQTAAEQAVRSLSAFRHEAELSTWTYRICYRTVLRHRRWYRRWLKRFTLDGPAVEPADRAPEVTRALEERERMRRLHRALDQLSEKRRAVVVMRDLEELDIAAIATIVGAAEPTVRSRLRDGRRQLARLLRDDPYFGDRACLEEVE